MHLLLTIELILLYWLIFRALFISSLPSIASFKAEKRVFFKNCLIKGKFREVLVKLLHLSLRWL